MMARHAFEPTHFHLTIGEHEPVLRVADAYERDSGWWKHEPDV